MLGAIGLSAIAVEKGLRLMGHWPPHSVIPIAEDFRWSEIDPQRGWRPRPGIWRANEPGNAPMTITAEHSRLSHPPDAKSGARTRIAWVGDSFSMGYGARDEETFPWLLNAALPGTVLENHAVAGYGTYQSFLTMKSLLASRRDPPISLVVYGYFDNHAARDAAPFDGWIKPLSENASGMGRERNHSYLVPPHVRMHGTRLVEYPPHLEPLWSLERRSTLVSLLHQARMTWRHPFPTRTEMHAITQTLLGMMRQTAASHGADFAIVVVMAAPSPHLAEDLGIVEAWARNNGAHYLNCAPPVLWEPEYRVGGNGHPNARGHQHYAACMEGAIRQWTRQD